MSSSGSGNFPLNFILKVQGDAEVVNKFKQIATSMGQVQPAATKAAQGTKQVETALKTTGTAANTASTNVKSYSGALSGFSSSNTQARTSTDQFGGALTGLGTSATNARGGLDSTNTVVKSSITPMANLGAEGQKTGSKMQSLTDVFRGNRGLIFSVTMLGSGISEAISMFQGYQDASDKLSDAKERLADLEERGLENTKEYGEATKDVADAQRGFNFIQRFTIQSFADLIPMSLMLTSSLMEMGATMNKGAGIKAKLATAGTKLISVMNGLGAAMMAFTVRHPLLLLLTALVAVGIAIVTNFMGVRDALNQVGVALGNALGPLKGVLEYFGLNANAAMDTAASYLDFGKTATAATTDVEKQVVKSGNATTMSYNGQIALMNKLGEESENIAFSMGAHLKMQQQDQEAHASKYAQFVNAMQSGDQEIMQSLGLTAEEYKTFYEEWEAELDEFDQKFATAVESIVDGWSQINDRGQEAATSLIEDINKIEGEITELTAQSWDLDEKDDIQKTNDKLYELQGKLETLKGSVSSATLEGAQNFFELQQAGTQAIDGIGMAILGQDFTGAINTLSTSIDQVPEKYRSNFSQIDSIIGNTALTNRQKVAQIISDYGSLEQAFKPLINGAYELSLSQAQAAAGLDELSVAARSNATNMGEAGAAWFTFLKSLSPAQKDLPIIQDLIARVNAGTITHAEALAEAEAAGVAWSNTLGKDVMTSIKNVEKSFIDLGNGTSAMVANVNGQMVNLGTVSNTELTNLSNDLGTTDTAMASTAKTADKELAGTAADSIGVLGKDGKFHFGTLVTNANNTIDVFKVVNTSAATYLKTGAVGSIKAVGTEMGTTAKTTKTETSNMGKDFETFKTNAVKWLGEVQTALDNLWKSAQERLKNTNFQNLFPSFPSAEGSSGDGQIPIMSGQKVDYDITPAIAKLDQLKAYVALTTSQISASFVTMETSIKGTLMRIGTAFTTAFVGLLPAANTATSQTSAAFVTMLTSITGTFTQIKGQITALQGAFSTLSTSVAIYATSMTTTVAAFIKASTTSIGAFMNVITALQGKFSTLSTSVSTYMKSMSAAIKTWQTTSTTAFNAIVSGITKAQSTASKFSTSWSTYMKSMTSAVKSFASAVTSAMNQVVSAANKATSALNKMAAAAKKAASAARGAGLMHGGIMMRASAATGFSGVVNSPTMYGSGLDRIKVGEDFKPELVTVTPLTRGTGNHTGNLQRATGGGGGGGPIMIENVIVLDGREMKRFVQKAASEGFGAQS